ncbi:rifin [Plasmodium reichenowi]|uniref:Rifin n=1 Tax=Plasmodium reichenowi TaxID=5854 RepID=A0A060RRG4_PLARE|nr:rifin [Plasmodium reichenowi]
MKVHYINILLFALPLNILEHNERNHNNTTLHTVITRSLCECELYAPANYDNDPQMKYVIDNFNKQTQERFHEYDDRMIEKRKQCKDKCDKEIQKIILKDKLEKELMDKFATLHTDIQSDAIPTCVCEKSVADKVEKTCLRCTQNLGGIVAPSSGVLAGIAEGALYAWKPGALDAAIKAAISKGATKIAEAAEAAGIQAGKEAIIESLKTLSVHNFWTDMSDYILKMRHYNNVGDIVSIIQKKNYEFCLRFGEDDSIDTICDAYSSKLTAYAEDGNFSALPKDALPKVLEKFAAEAKGPADAAAEVARESATTGITEKETVLFEAGFNSSISSINAAIIASIVASCRYSGRKEAIIESLKTLSVHNFWTDMSDYILKMRHYNNVGDIVSIIQKKNYEFCLRFGEDDSIDTICDAYSSKLTAYAEDGNFSALPKDALPKVLEKFAAEAKGPADAAAEVARESATTGITEKETVLFEAGFNSSISSINAAIIASIVAIIIIVLVMVIIYKILRYGRKKKMKKKLQYIKLLEE